MTFWQWFRFIAGALLILGGLFTFITAIIGNFRLNYVLCRMHAAGLGDTLGIFLIFAGITVLFGISILTLKLAVILALFWVSGPTVSHLIMRMEIENGSPAEKKEENKK